MTIEWQAEAVDGAPLEAKAERCHCQREDRQAYIRRSEAPTEHLVSDVGRMACWGA
ncbi:MAG: hypothetical protein ACR2MB_16790 [Acidimicrobiales bacterium]